MSISTTITYHIDLSKPYALKIPDRIYCKCCGCNAYLDAFIDDMFSKLIIYRCSSHSKHTRHILYHKDTKANVSTKTA